VNNSTHKCLTILRDENVQSKSDYVFKKKSTHIGFIASSIGFPNGMAGAQRVKLLARGMIENDIYVTLLHLRVSEFPPYIHNSAVKGDYNGISFEYTTGTTTRPNNFWKRRLVEMRGTLVGLYRLHALKKQGKLDCVYYYGGVLQFTTLKLLFLQYLKQLEIPVIMDLCERPWSLGNKTNSIGQIISPISGIKGVVAISKFLSKWTLSESQRINHPVKLLKVPILIDINDFGAFSLYSDSRPKVLFAASSGYDNSFSFVLDAMSHVWKQIPECQLIITGIEPSRESSRQLLREIQGRSCNQNVILKGYISREELLQEYATSNALLAPLFDDVRSRARFPTKIGEYLASRRPLITNNVGEICEYLQDGISAAISEPGDPIAFGEKIIYVLQNPELAERIGKEGWRIAYEHFHYQIHSKQIADLVRGISS